MNTQPQPKALYSFAAETKLDKIAGYVLLIGAIVSAILIGTGLVIFMLHPTASSIMAKPIPVAFRAAFRGDPVGFINVGVVVLLATPLLRVLTAIIGFAALKWWRFAIVSLAVLVLLLISFFVAA